MRPVDIAHGVSSKLIDVHVSGTVISIWYRNGSPRSKRCLCVGEVTQEPSARPARQRATGFIPDEDDGNAHVCKHRSLGNGSGAPTGDACPCLARFDAAGPPGYVL
jgi:hypothetical protein